MEQKFTQNDLVQLLYSEKSHAETLALIDAICQNWDLKEQFQSFYETHQAMPKAKLNPSNACIDSILDYANLSQGVAC